MISKIFVAIVLLSIAVNSQNDASSGCQAVLCAEGFRCQNGICLKQHIKPKKSLCLKSFESYKDHAIKCTNREYPCNPAISSASCGYTKTGEKVSFSDDCSPCLHESIDFYFKESCEAAPDVCKQNEECLNFKCVVLFDSAKDKDRKVCNTNNDCKKFVQICVANKCATKMELLSGGLSKSNIISP